jgi:hypothetical protein
MSLSRCAVIAVLLGVFLGSAGPAHAAAAPQGQQPAQQKTAAPPLLPEQFGGWQLQGPAATSKDPAAADPSNAAVLVEYGFTDLAIATYARDDGRTLKIRAARFADASGAFGAYTFYLQPEMQREEFGPHAQGASGAGHRVLFFTGHVLIDAQFSQQSAMSAEQLRELAAVLPRPEGSLGNLPSFIGFMPHRSSIVNTQKYVMGPAALAAQAPPISAELVDFGTSAEVSLGRYDTGSGEATLMVISYPTPQLAADHLRRIDAALHQPLTQPGVSSPGVCSTGAVGELCYKRSGPLLVVAAGPASASDAKALLGMVNYEASVTWNQATDQHEVRDLYQLVLNVVILCAILGGFAIVAGVAFGGFRILMKRWYPERVFDRPEQMEFISLHLAETGIQGRSQSGSDGARSNPAERS